jgi:predicted PurR-regulated permease PerM
MRMQFREHVSTTGTALKNWLVATLYDALAVGLMWFAGLLIIGVPWAPLWAVLAGLFQFVPQLGPVLAIIGPAFAILFTGGEDRQFVYLLILYAIIAIVDGLFLQPYLMKRTTKVPIWASLLTPIVLGILIPFWGVLLAPPLLAILYTYRARKRAGIEQRVPQPPA